MPGLIQLHLLEQLEKSQRVMQRAAGQQCAPESELLMGSHLIFQLILPVHFMLGDIEIVSGVIINGLYKAENIEDRIFQYFRKLENIQKCGANDFDWDQDSRGALVRQPQQKPITPTHSSLNRYGSSNGGSGGDGRGSGGGGAPQGCWLLLPRVNICWKLMSVWVQLSTQSATPMVTPGAPVRPACLRAPRLSMLDSRGSRMSRVGSPERRESSFPFT